MTKKLLVSVKVISLGICICAFLGSTSVAQDATVMVNAGSVIYTIPDDLYGYNATIWDGNQNGSSTSYNNLLKNAGFKVMRWPGGSWGDIVEWDNVACYASYAVTYAQSKSLFSNLGIRLQPIVNFSGMYCNVQHTNTEANTLAANWVADGALGAKYWEVGNEIGGSWEQGYTTASNYGTRFAAFYKAMKAKNGNNKIIAVGDPNISNGWSATVLANAKAQGVTPDGWQIHNYPGYSGNVGLLHGEVDGINTFTSNMNSIGASGYCMTEFGASGNDRWLKMIGGQLTLQYLMEMAKNKWLCANIFGEIYNTTTFAAAPAWYVYAFLYGKYGRDVVQTTNTLTNGDIRAYASKNGNNLTIWVCNNAYTSKSVKLNISSYTPATTGTIWTMEGSNAGEESYDIKINGVTHPSEANARTMAGNSIATGSSFTITVPMSSMTLIQLTPGSGGCSPTAIVPYIQVNGGIWTQTSSATVTSGSTVVLGPQPLSGGSWSWTGCGTSGTSREQTFITTSSCTATATYTNTSGCQSTQTFTTTVSGSGGSSIVSGGTYEILARHSGKSLNITGKSTTDGALVEQWTYNAGTNQQFVITDVGGGYYRISPASNTNEALDVSGWSTADGAAIDQWTYSGGSNQQWQLAANGSYYNIISQNSGKCLDVNGASTADGSAVIQWTCGTGTNQQFTISRLKSAPVIADEDASGNITISPNPSDGTFKVEGIASGMLKIFDLNGKLMLSRNIENNATVIKSSLMPGLYIIKIMEQNKVNTIRLVVR